MKKYCLYLLSILFLGCGTTDQSDSRTITILHTNDTHSQIEPVASGSNANKGGYARRMGMIEQLRNDSTVLFLFDSGDFSQGTPYFNFFHGRVEVDAMNRMGYDVVTLGNHEFDNGVDTLAAILHDAQFQVVCANYEVTGTPLESIVKPYVVLERNGVRVGVLGLGVQPDNLINPRMFAPVKWLNPLPVANEIADKLRNKEYCDVVICLSHLGTEEEKSEICDRWIAANSRNIDVILGGHTHSIISTEKVINLDGKEVILSQMGKAGARIGKMTIELTQ